MGLNFSEWGDRRQSGRWAAESGEAFWVPERSEIVTQFFTRYLFFALAVIYFSTLEAVPGVLFGIEQLLVALGVYFVVNTWFFRQQLQGVTLAKIRGAMVADLLIVTLCVIHDPNPIPPSALAFLMVLLGNGMRYGMRLFGEVLGGAVLGMAIAFALRYRLGGFDIGAGEVFFGVFWVTLALYAYILMGRIEGQRRQLDYRSRYDMLTGLLNRHGLLAAADQIFDPTGGRAPATVLFADLNKFKAVNDSTAPAWATGCWPSSRASSMNRSKWACAGAGAATSSSPSCRSATTPRSAGSSNGSTRAPRPGDTATACRWRSVSASATRRVTAAT
jgi:hypothetical protein